MGFNIWKKAQQSIPPVNKWSISKVSNIWLNTPQGDQEKTLTSPPCGAICPQQRSFRPAATLIFQDTISTAEKQSPCWQMDGMASWLWGHQFSRGPEVVWGGDEGQKPPGNISIWDGEGDVSSLGMTDGSDCYQVEGSSPPTCPLTRSNLYTAMVKHWTANRSYWILVNRWTTSRFMGVEGNVIALNLERRHY